MTLFRPLCFKRQYESNLEIHINTLPQHHTMVCWYIDNKPEETKKVEIEGPDMTIKSLHQEGLYKFYTEDDKGNRSAEMSVWFNYESTADEFGSIKNSMKEFPEEPWANKICNFITSAYNENPEVPVIEHILNKMKGTKDITPKERNFFYQLLLAAEYYLNTRNLAMNHYSISNARLLYGAQLNYLTGVPSVKIITYEKLSKDKLKPVKVYSASSLDRISVNMMFSEKTDYEIVVMQKRDVINWFWHYQPDEEFTSYLWQMNQNEEEQAQDLLYSSMITETSGLNFTDEEKMWLNAEMNKNPYNYALSAPVVFRDNETDITFYIENYGFIKAADDDYYISSKEDDLLFDNHSGRREKITRSYVTLNKKKHCLGGNTLFYIEDKNGTIVSPLTRYSFDQDTEDYQEKTRLYKRGVHQKRLLESIERYMPGLKSYMNDVMLMTLHNPDITNENFHISVIDEIANSCPEVDEVVKLIFLILTDLNKNFNYHSDFFDKPVVYHYDSDVLSIPSTESAQKDFVVVFAYKEFGGSHFIYEFYKGEDKSLDISLKNKSIFYAYAINLKDYHRSGFILADNNNMIDPKIFTSSLNVERSSD